MRRCCRPWRWPGRGTHEEPRYIFLHYWGKGKAVDLAKAVKTALIAQQAVK